MKKRADLFLKEEGYFESRKKAADAIQAGLVFINGKKISKASKEVSGGEVRILEDESLKHVSRGALKLAGAQKEWNLDFQNKIVLDLGASTGGFTDFLLQQGAKRVYAVDVGSGQLHQKLRDNRRVVNLEKTDARFLNRDIVPDKIDFVVSDLSFISLIKVFKPVFKLLGKSFDAVLLFKPQFEVGLENISRGGIVKDGKVVKEKLEETESFFKSLGFKVYRTRSPIRGGDGNVEYLFYLRNESN